VYRQSLTGNRIPLTDTNIFSIASNYAKGVVPKYQVSVETAVVWLMATFRYYFDARMAKYAGTFVPVAAHMCVAPCATPIVMFAAPEWNVCVHVPVWQLRPHSSVLNTHIWPAHLSCMTN